MHQIQGCDRSNGNEQQNQQSVATVIPSAPSQYLVPHTQLELGHSIARVAYPYADPYIGGIVAAYGAQPMYLGHRLNTMLSLCPLAQKLSERICRQGYFHLGFGMILFGLRYTSKLDLFLLGAQATLYNCYAILVKNHL
eukprot:Gb_32705 [translate_table: standard]